MAGSKPIEVSEMGIGGVNLVKSPLHLNDNELVLAQNAEPYRDRGVAGIRKRVGLQKVVPTGTVAPSAASGAVTGIVPIFGAGIGAFRTPETSPGYVGVSATTGYYWNGSVWVAFTSSTTAAPTEAVPLLGLLPNTKYSGGFAYSALYPATRVWNWYVFGGKESGQLLGFDGLKIVELARLSATGAQNDTLTLPHLWANDISIAGSSDDEVIEERRWVVCATTDGGIQLFDVLSGTVRKLPAPSANMATGCVGIGNRLWVAAGLSVYTIRPDFDTAWTTAYTCATANVTKLTGLAVTGAALYAGTENNLNNTRIQRLIYTYSTGALTLSQSGGNDSLQIFGGGAVFLGPFNFTSRGMIGLYNKSTVNKDIYRFVSSFSWTVEFDAYTNAFGSSNNIFVRGMAGGSFAAEYLDCYINSATDVIVRSWIYTTPPFQWTPAVFNQATAIPIYPFFAP